VVPVDHDELGQEPKAFIVPTPGMEVDPEELAAFCAESLAYFKVPTHWEIRTESLPRNATGKVVKQALVDGESLQFDEGRRIASDAPRHERARRARRTTALVLQEVQNGGGGGAVCAAGARRSRGQGEPDRALRRARPGPRARRACPSCIAPQRRATTSRVRTATPASSWVCASRRCRSRREAQRCRCRRDRRKRRRCGPTASSRARSDDRDPRSIPFSATSASRRSWVSASR